MNNLDRHLTGMIMKRTMILLLLMMPFLYGVQAQEVATRTLTVKVQNLKNDKGSLHIAVYNDEKGFLRDIYQVMTLEAKKGEIEATFSDLPEGVYAVTVYHDKNNNGKLDTNFLGSLKEPIGASNEIDGRFREPDWNDAKFLLTRNNRKIRIKF